MAGAHAGGTLRNLSLAALLVTVVACSDSDTRLESTIPADTGGLLMADGLTLAIPPGALATDQIIRISTEAAGLDAAVTPVFHIEPADVTLTADALVGIRLPPDTGAGVQLARLGDDDAVVRVQDMEVDTTAGEIRGRTRVLGRFVVFGGGTTNPSAAHDATPVAATPPAGPDPAPAIPSMPAAAGQADGLAGPAASDGVDPALIGTWQGEGAYAAYVLELDAGGFNIRQDHTTVRSGRATAAGNHITLIDGNGVHESGTYEVQGPAFRMQTTSGAITWRRVDTTPHATGGFFSPTPAPAPAGVSTATAPDMPATVVASDPPETRAAGSGGFFGKLGSRVQNIGRKAVDTVRNQAARLNENRGTTRQQTGDLPSGADPSGEFPENRFPGDATTTDVD